jgi:DNA-binding GntR family transcriptional regulator
VLAERLAAALVHHEPGWRLPRQTALARRYNVSTAQIEAAILQLINRHLIRRLPGGQLYRVSPAEYLVPLHGVPGLVSQVDPMGGELTCRSSHISWRRVSEEIGWALRIDPAEPTCVLRLLWAVDGERAACATTYLPAGQADRFIDTSAVGTATADIAAALSLLPLSSSPEPEAPSDELAPLGTPRTLQLEMQLPPPAVARSLRLSAGQPAVMITVLFDDPATSVPVALTVTVLRPDLFRIVIQTSRTPLTDDRENSFLTASTHVMEDWEP